MRSRGPGGQSVTVNKSAQQWVLQQVIPRADGLDELRDERLALSDGCYSG